MVLRRNIYKGVYLQRGRGIGAVLSGLFRVLVPFLKRGATAALKSAPVKKALKTAGSAAAITAGDFAADVLKGKNPKKKAGLNLQQAQKGIQKALEETAFKHEEASPVKPKAAKKRAPGQLFARRPNKIKKKKVQTSLL